MSHRLRGVTSTVIEETYTGNLDVTWDGELGDHELQPARRRQVHPAQQVGRRQRLSLPVHRPGDDAGRRSTASTRSFADGRGEPYRRVPGFDLMAPNRVGL